MEPPGYVIKKYDNFTFTGFWADFITRRAPCDVLLLGQLARVFKSLKHSFRNCGFGPIYWCRDDFRGGFRGTPSSFFFFLRGLFAALLAPMAEGEELRGKVILD